MAATADERACDPSHLSETATARALAWVHLTTLSADLEGCYHLHQGCGVHDRTVARLQVQWVSPTPSWQWGPPQCSTILPSRMRRMAVPLISTGWPDAPTP